MKAEIVPAQRANLDEIDAVIEAVPPVVNCRDATTRIPEGALVEVDGDRGTVRVVAPPESAG